MTPSAPAALLPETSAPPRRVDAPRGPGPFEPPDTRPISQRDVQLVLFPARAFLAFGWLRAGIEKAVDPAWWGGAELVDFIAEQRTATLPFFQPLVDALVLPAPAVTAALVALIELGIGLALLTGRRAASTLVAACALNVIFVMLGVVSPSAFYLTIQGTMLVWLATANGWWTTTRRLVAAAAGGVAALSLLPFVTTLHPAEVIDDPAIVLATLAGLGAFGQIISVVLERSGSSSTSTT